MKAIQDLIKHNHCFGCGPSNDQGLQLKSYYLEDGSYHARFLPKRYHNAGPQHVLNGGIQATLIDCHSVCAAMADAYRRAGREPGEGEALWYATGQMEINYLKPVPIEVELELMAVIQISGEKKTRVHCELLSQGKLCAKGEVTAVKVPGSWHEPPVTVLSS